MLGMESKVCIKHMHYINYCPPSLDMVVYNELCLPVAQFLCKAKQSKKKETNSMCIACLETLYIQKIRERG